MTAKFVKYYAGITLLVLIIGSVIFYRSLPGYDYGNQKKNIGDNTWQAPDTMELRFTPADNLIRYGRQLIANTAFYLGPKGAIAHISNGMNCQNCHLDAGTRSFGSNFALVASTYPKYRERSGRIEPIESRINECMQRSLNGEKLDSLSGEMRAMVNYINWVGKNIDKGAKPQGAGLDEIPYLNRAASVTNGKAVYENKCRSCHGEKGQGLFTLDSSAYSYPPLWGSNSFNVSAGMFRLSRLASFVKYNMPYKPIAGAPQLTDEEAWDVAAFINTQERPVKVFSSDWPDIKAKPVDYPFGPYADNFSAAQHKYGPFEEIKQAKASLQKKPQ